MDVFKDPVRPSSSSCSLLASSFQTLNCTNYSKAHFNTSPIFLYFFVVLPLQLYHFLTHLLVRCDSIIIPTPPQKPPKLKKKIHNTVQTKEYSYNANNSLLFFTIPAFHLPPLFGCKT